MRIILRDGSGEMQLRYLSEEPDRHGNVRVYYRRAGRRVRMRSGPGTPEFFDEYRRIAGAKPTPAPSRSADARSFTYLCQQYYRSAEFKRLQRKSVRRRLLDEISIQHGALPYSEMKARNIRQLRDARADAPGTANEIVKALRQVFAWAKENELVDTNPARDVPYLPPINPDGFHVWTAAEIEQYQATHPVGTKARLALDLLRYTGVRRSDVVKLGRQMERGGILHFTETKGRDHRIKHRDIPIIPALRHSIDATPSGHMAYLVTAFGKPFTRNGFGNWFKKQCRAAGLEHCSAHGIRKADATEAAEGGATEHELMALFGWDSPKQAALYTKKANRQKLTARAIRFLDPEQNSTATVAPNVGATKHAKNAT